MDTYDPTSASKSFAAAAEEAERYLREVRCKLKTNRSYEHVHDDHLAKFYVFNYLHGRPFLASREAFLSELTRLKSSAFPPPSEVFAPERFERHRQAYLGDLIRRYGGEEHASGS